MIYGSLINTYGDQERRFSKLLEVLSIVAWKQPITRSEIEGIGVDSSNSVRNLMKMIL